MSNYIPPYTPDGMHPEDAIYKVKTFIKELRRVQNDYFTKLSSELNLTKEGEDWLFDYVYNTEDEYDGFDHYLQDFKKNYDDMIKKDTMYSDSLEPFFVNDIDEFDPMLHMSSYEPELETSFASPYDDNPLPVPGLDTITVKSPINDDTK